MVDFAQSAVMITTVTATGRCGFVASKGRQSRSGKQWAGFCFLFAARSAHPWITYRLLNYPRQLAIRQVVSKERVAGCPTCWYESFNGNSWEPTAWFWGTCWRKLAEVTNYSMEKGSQALSKGNCAEAQATAARTRASGRGTTVSTDWVMARTVKFLATSGGP
jgi:hypothetical protein